MFKTVFEFAFQSDALQLQLPTIRQKNYIVGLLSFNVDCWDVKPKKTTYDLKHLHRNLRAICDFTNVMGRFAYLVRWSDAEVIFPHDFVTQILYVLFMNFI